MEKCANPKTKKPVIYICFRH